MRNTKCTVARCAGRQLLSTQLPAPAAAVLPGAATAGRQARAPGLPSYSPIKGVGPGQAGFAADIGAAVRNGEHLSRYLCSEVL